MSGGSCAIGADETGSGDLVRERELRRTPRGVSGGCCAGGATSAITAATG